MADELVILKDETNGPITITIPTFIFERFRRSAIYNHISFIITI